MTDLSEKIAFSPAVLDAVRYEGVRHGSHSVSETLGHRFEEWARTACGSTGGRVISSVVRRHTRSDFSPHSTRDFSSTKAFRPRPL